MHQFDFFRRTNFTSASQGMLSQTQTTDGKAIIFNPGKKLRVGKTWYRGYIFSCVATRVCFH